MLAGPETPDLEIRSECGGALGSDFGSGGNIVRHC